MTRNHGVCGSCIDPCYVRCLGETEIERNKNKVLRLDDESNEVGCDELLGFENGKREGKVKVAWLAQVK